LKAEKQMGHHKRVTQLKI